MDPSHPSDDLGLLARALPRLTEHVDRVRATLADRARDDNPSLRFLCDLAHANLVGRCREHPRPDIRAAAHQWRGCSDPARALLAVLDAVAARERETPRAFLAAVHFDHGHGHADAAGTVVERVPYQGPESFGDACAAAATLAARYDRRGTARTVTRWWVVA